MYNLDIFKGSLLHPNNPKTLYQLVKDNFKEPGKHRNLEEDLSKLISELISNSFIIDYRDNQITNNEELAKHLIQNIKEDIASNEGIFERYTIDPNLTQGREKPKTTEEPKATTEKPTQELSNDTIRDKFNSMVKGIVKRFPIFINELVKQKIKNIKKNIKENIDGLAGLLDKKKIEGKKKIEMLQVTFESNINIIQIINHKFIKRLHELSDERSNHGNKALQFIKQLMNFDKKIKKLLNIYLNVDTIKLDVGDGGEKQRNIDIIDGLYESDEKNIDFHYKEIVRYLLEALYTDNTDDSTKNQISCI